MTFPQDTGARPHNLGEAIHRLRGRWGWFVGFGALATALGVAVLGYLVVAGTIASVYMIAIAMIVAGGAEIGLGLNARTWGMTALWIVVGLLYIVAGAFARLVRFESLRFLGIIGLIHATRCVGLGDVSRLELLLSTHVSDLLRSFPYSSPREPPRSSVSPGRFVMIAGIVQLGVRPVPDHGSLHV